MSSESESEARHDPDVARVYQTEQVEVTWAPGRCIHYGACFNNSLAAFDPRRRPWVNVEAEPPERLDEIIGECPTGALHLRWLDGRPAVSEPQETLSVWPSLDGPLFLRGPVELYDRDGNLLRTDTRIALCRCGHSEHKPFCDDSHYRVGFRSQDAYLGVPDEHGPGEG